MRKIFVAASLAFLTSVALAQSASAKGKLPHAMTWEQLRGWCEDQGGFFWADDPSLRSYGCMLDDGTMIVCKLISGGIICQESSAPVGFPAPKITQRTIVTMQGVILAKQQNVETSLDRLRAELEAVTAGQARLLERIDQLERERACPGVQ